MSRSKQITKKPDLWSGLFFFVLGGMVCIFSVGIGLGTRLKPGPGFLPFLAGSVLSFLSIVLLVQAYVSAELGSWIIKISWGKIAVVLISLLAYGFFLERIGFTFVTFLFMVFCMGAIESQSWKKVIVVGLLSTLGAYLLFETFLKSQLPRTFLGIF